MKKDDKTSIHAPHMEFNLYGFIYQIMKMDPNLVKMHLGYVSIHEMKAN